MSVAAPPAFVTNDPYVLVIIAESGWIATGAGALPIPDGQVAFMMKRHSESVTCLVDLSEETLDVALMRAYQEL